MDDGVAHPAGVDGVLDGARGVDAPGARDTGTGERGGVESAVAPSSSLSASPSFVNRIPSETEPVLAGAPSSSLSLSLSSSSASSSSSSSASPPLAGGLAAPTRILSGDRITRSTLASSASQYSSYASRSNASSEPDAIDASDEELDRASESRASFSFPSSTGARLDGGRRLRRAFDGRSEGGSISLALRLDRVMSAVLGRATLGGARAAAPPSCCTYTSNVIRPSSNDASISEVTEGHECVRS